MNCTASSVVLSAAREDELDLEVVPGIRRCPSFKTAPSSFHPLVSPLALSSGAQVR
jgi:hypothetical protein